MNNSSKIDFDNRVREVLNRDAASERSRGQELSELIEIRVDPFGQFYFVRRGAPLDPVEISSLDHVDVSDIYDWKRGRKRDQFNRLVKDPHYTGPIMLAEGDSWFEYPFVPDLLDLAGKKLAVLSLARAGATWGTIIDDDSDPPKRYSDNSLMGVVHTLKELRTKPFGFVMLSAGGNDLIGQIQHCVFYFDPKRPEDEYINHTGVGAFDAILGNALNSYRSKIRDILALGQRVILHTYDYPDPRENGQYIGFPLRHYRKIEGVGLMRRIVNQMMDFFHDGLAEIARQSGGRVHLIDLRNTIGTDDYVKGPDPTLWADEMHGNTRGFELLWKNMDKQLSAILPKAEIPTV